MKILALAVATVAFLWANVEAVLGAFIVFAVVIQVAGLLAYYHFWKGVNWDDGRVQVDDVDAARQMWDLSDPQWSTLIPQKVA